MKRTTYFPKLRNACLMLLFALSCEAKYVKIHVPVPGSLAEQISEKSDSTLTDLALTGCLNGDDLRLLREKATTGLRRIDLHGVTFTAGGGSYAQRPDDGQALFVEEAGKLPDYLFFQTGIEEIVLPETVDTLGEYSLAQTQLGHIRLPEYAVLMDGALQGNEKLGRVDFAETTAAIYPDCFSDCPRLEKIQMNNVAYIAARSFCRLAGLKRWEVKGWLGHMDGWYTVSECPQLTAADFHGPVFSTGGPNAFAQCPMLKEVTFHDVVWNTNFGEAQDCPAFQGYKAQSYVYDSSETGYIAPSADVQLFTDRRYARALEEARAIWQTVEESGKIKEPFLTSTMPAVFYQSACQALHGNQPQEEAATDLELAMYLGFDDWDAFYADSAQWNRLLDGTPLLTRLHEHFYQQRMKYDYLYILRQSAPYGSHEATDLPKFTYAPPSDSLLNAIRNHFNLDSIAGKGNDEVAQIKNIMYWLHDNILHDGSSSWPDCRYNAIDLIELARREERGYNCRFIAMILNDLYLAMGFPSRFLTCESKAYDTDPDCHVINIVWSRQLGKWVWMDASFAAYVTDENGLLLHPGEVRARLISGDSLYLNPDANWNHQQQQTKEDYLERYMAKNLYVISAYVRSESETESINGSSRSAVVALAPEGFAFSGCHHLTSDSTYFWQAPQQQDSIEVGLTGTVSLPGGSIGSPLMAGGSLADLRLGGTIEIPVRENRFDFCLRPLHYSMDGDMQPPGKSF